MAYDPEIAAHIHQIVAGWPKIQARKMFGGVCHLLDGNIFCGVYQNYLILRLGADQAARALAQPHVKAFDITGKPMQGWVMVSKSGLAHEQILRQWLEKAHRFVKTLPPK